MHPQTVARENPDTMPGRNTKGWHRGRPNLVSQGACRLNVLAAFIPADASSMDSAGETVGIRRGRSRSWARPATCGCQSNVHLSVRSDAIRAMAGNARPLTGSNALSLGSTSRKVAAPPSSNLPMAQRNRQHPWGRTAKAGIAMTPALGQGSAPVAVPRLSCATTPLVACWHDGGSRRPRGNPEFPKTAPRPRRPFVGQHSA